jgi:hypothetical protein
MALFTDGMARKSKLSPGLPDAALGGPSFAVQQLQLGHAQQVAWIVHLLDRALPRHLVVLAQDGGQPQLLQVMFQQQLRSVGRMSRGIRFRSIGAAHAHTSSTPASRVM